MKDQSTQLLANQIIANAQTTDRYMVAIAGSPASGKSTLAEQLSLLINQQCHSQVSEVIPMDGFHLDNSVLDELELRHRKGAENTFDSEAFVAIIKRLHKANQVVSIPLFDRASDRSIANAKDISLTQKILIIEGNYLLLNTQPWSELHTIYDYKVLLKPNIEIIEQRLIQRWINHGYDLEGATQRALSNDIPNAEYVLKHSVAADLLIK